MYTNNSITTNAKTKIPTNTNVHIHVNTNTGLKLILILILILIFTVVQRLTCRQDDTPWEGGTFQLEACPNLGTCCELYSFNQRRYAARLNLPETSTGQAGGRGRSGGGGGGREGAGGGREGAAGAGREGRGYDVVIIHKQLYIISTVEL